jgi:hypothetical protein
MISKKYGGGRGPPPTKPIATVQNKTFAPLRAADMYPDSSGTEATSNEEAVPGNTGRPPPIILTSTTNQIQLAKQLQNVIKGNFEFRNTSNGTRVITRSMADFQSVKSHFDTSNLSYYSLYPKSEKPLKAVIRHLPHNTLQKTYLTGWRAPVLTLLASSR